MRKSTYMMFILVLGWLVLPVNQVSAEAPKTISQLSAIDRQFLEQQRTRIDEMARSEPGRQLSSNRMVNLSILQTILDRRLVRADMTLELQAMGVILGDELARDLGMDWVIVEDRYGRSRALRLGSSDNYLFPITMISRRVEAGATVSVNSVYKKAHDIIAPLKDPMPFQ